TTDEIVLNEEENECRQKMDCTGCTQALECLSVWEAKLPGAVLEVGAKEFALRVFEPTNGTCG
ncbi:MAG: hypothetical protein Q7K34_02760, partial [archaeon]|nr:hypothetical protein [archaeon]